MCYPRCKSSQANDQKVMKVNDEDSLELPRGDRARLNKLPGHT